MASGEIIPKKIDHAKYIKSVITIQRAWRRYAARKATRKRIRRLEEALGMTIPSWQSYEVFAKDQENFQHRRALMAVFDARTKKAINDERTRVNISHIVFLFYMLLWRRKKGSIPWMDLKKSDLSEASKNQRTWLDGGHYRRDS